MRQKEFWLCDSALYLGSIPRASIERDDRDRSSSLFERIGEAVCERGCVARAQTFESHIQACKEERLSRKGSRRGAKDAQMFRAVLADDVTGATGFSHLRNQRPHGSMPDCDCGILRAPRFRGVWSYLGFVAGGPSACSLNRVALQILRGQHQNYGQSSSGLCT